MRLQDFLLQGWEWMKTRTRDKNSDQIQNIWQTWKLSSKIGPRFLTQKHTKNVPSLIKKSSWRVENHFKSD